MNTKSILQFAAKSHQPILYLSSILLILILCSCSGKDNKELSSSNTINKLSVVDHSEVYIEVNSDDKTIEMLIPGNSQLQIEKVKLKLLIHANATTNINSSIEYDLSNPFEIQVTAEDNTISVYTLNATVCEGGKSAVLVSDTQNDIIPLFRQSDFFNNANNVLDKAFDADIPIYYIMLKSLKGTHKWDLPEQLHYYDNGLIIDKHDVMDAFDRTILHKELLSKGISKVYVIGVSSMGCVMGTCRGAVKLKYELTLISDAHSEPKGYREESAIDQCNEEFENSNLGSLIKADELEF
jgi:nicotinamidase-related amidase